MAGCRAAITAEKLEASIAIERIDPMAPPKVEVHIEPGSDGPGPDSSD